MRVMVWHPTTSGISTAPSVCQEGRDRGGREERERGRKEGREGGGKEGGEKGEEKKRGCLQGGGPPAKDTTIISLTKFVRREGAS